MTPALTGKRIVVTRAREQAGSLVEALENQGADAISVPAIEVVPPLSYEALDQGLKRLQQFDWLILTSANTVRALRRRAVELGVQLSPAQQSKLRVAAIGAATAKAAEKAGFSVDLVPDTSVAEAVLASLGDTVRGRLVFYPRAAAAREVIPQGLRTAGAEVEIADAYRTVAPEASVAKLRELKVLETPDAVVFSSSSTARNFIELLRRSDIKAPPRWKAVSIGPITSQTLRQLGWEPAREATQATVAGLVDSCINLLSSP